LPEALEKWPVDLMGRLLPRHMMLIERIDADHAARHPDRSTPIVADGEVNMGTLSFRHGQPGQRGFGAAYGAGEGNGLCRSACAASCADREPDQWRDAAPLAACLQPAAVGHHHRGHRRGLGSAIWSAVGIWRRICATQGLQDAIAGAKRANKVDLSNWVAATHGVSA
jgi:glycogen phosphorylase